uniref:Uncharacterized protein n=1 Tax=Arundo donax TaxID=35708 RepID=A0A0A9AVK0_ARUDO
MLRTPWSEWTAQGQFQDAVPARIPCHCR